MGTADGRHGRRDNGLTATEYAAAGDVDPRVGEHLLDVLALEGIAAYLRPSSDLHPVTRTNLLPGRPTDRLYVDRHHLGTARDYLARLAESPAESPAERTVESTVERPEPSPAGDAAGEAASEVRDGPAAAATPTAQSPPERPPVDPTADPPAAGSRREPDFDGAWAEIVAGLQADGPRRAWPEPEDQTRSGRIGPGRSRLTLGGRVAPSASPADEPSLLDGLDTFGADLPDAEEEEEEEFTPPPAPPVPRPSAATVLAVVGIVGGLAVFLRPELLPTSAGLAMFTGVVALLAGFGALIWRLRPGGDDDEPDPDDGARV